jgi:hypothetical protein
MLTAVVCCVSSVGSPGERVFACARAKLINPKVHARPLFKCADLPPLGTWRV